jgi:hypothetical protein
MRGKFHPRCPCAVDRCAGFLTHLLRPTGAVIAALPRDAIIGTTPA